MLLPRITTLLLVCTAYQTRAEIDLITEPRPGEEYVLVSAGHERAINFESSHKIPEKLPHQHVSRPMEAGPEKPKKSIKSYAVETVSSSKSSVKNHRGEGIVSIEEDKKYKKANKDKVTEAVEIDVPASKLEEIRIKETVLNVDTNPNIGVDFEAMSESGKLNEGSGTTTQKPVLTMRPLARARNFDIIPINFDSIDDINSGLLSSNVKLEPAGSEQKQHSRIQIKKGPNGQDYEYEYIYYYEDEEDDATKGKDLKTSTETIHNSHDGPHKTDNDNQISKNSSKDLKYANKYSSIERSTSTTTAPTTTVIVQEAQNEVLPASQRTRYRGRNLTPAPVQEEVNEERLPASTRFPPRSRNLNTTPSVPEVSSEPAKQRSRGQADNTADESIGQTRSRTRAHVRRPSSELVDLASFNTHSSDIPLSQYKEIPSRFSAEGKANAEAVEPLRTSKAAITNQSAKQENQLDLETPREAHSLSGGSKAQEFNDDSKPLVSYKQTTDSYFDRDTTEYTTMMAMEKVALDLYAYLAGENLNNEVNPTTNDVISFDGTTTEFLEESSTAEQTSTTEEPTTMTTTPTTTTTTTPAPTTTTVAPTASTRASRFKNRAGIRSRVSSASTSTTEAPLETSTKVRGRFNRPSFGGARSRTSTVAPALDASVEETASKQESTQTQAAPKPALGRARFGGRTRPTTSTTQAPSSTAAVESGPVSDQTPRTRLRPAFHLRERRPLSSASSTAAPSSDASPAASVSATGAEAAQDEVSEAPAAPTKGLSRGRLPGLRPLRPGPRLNIGRGASTPASSPITEAGLEPAVASAEHHEEASAEPTETSSANPLQRLRGRPRLQVAPSPKPKTAVASPVRRPNPLISRRRPTAEVSEAPTESAEVATEAPEASTGPSESPKEPEPESPEAPAETTPAPRALSNLLARRRLVQRRPGTVA